MVLVINSLCLQKRSQGSPSRPLRERLQTRDAEPSFYMSAPGSEFRSSCSAQKSLCFPGHLSSSVHDGHKSLQTSEWCLIYLGQMMGKLTKQMLMENIFPPPPPLTEVSECLQKTSGLKTETHRDRDQRDQLQSWPGRCFYDHPGSSVFHLTGITCHP